MAIDGSKAAHVILSKDSANNIKRKSVESTDIRSIGHDPRTNQLTIRFHSGPEVYIYSGVSARIYKRLMAARSTGKCFAEHVKGKFSFRVSK